MDEPSFGVDDGVLAELEMSEELMSSLLEEVGGCATNDLPALPTSPPYACTSEQARMRMRRDENRRALPEEEGGDGADGVTVLRVRNEKSGGESGSGRVGSKGRWTESSDRIEFRVGGRVVGVGTAVGGVGNDVGEFDGGEEGGEDDEDEENGAPGGELFSDDAADLVNRRALTAQTERRLEKLTEVANEPKAVAARCFTAKAVEHLLLGQFNIPE